MAVQPTRCAVVDVGSNSVRILAADVKDDGSFTQVFKESEATRLAAGLSAKGSLSQECMENTIRTMQRFLHLAADSGCGRVFCFATAAVREASNRDEFICMVHKHTKLLIRVLTDVEEAQMGFAGAGAGEYRGVIDIGGGSTEFAVGEGLTPTFTESLRMGAVRAIEMYPPGDLPDELTMEAMRQWAESRLRPVLPSLEPYRGWNCPHWYCMGGTARCLAALDQYLPAYDREKIHGYSLPRVKVNRMLQELCAMPIDERQKMPLMTRRADIILGGATILSVLMEHLDLPAVQVSDTDNLEGFLAFQIHSEQFKALEENQ